MVRVEGSRSGLSRVRICAVCLGQRANRFEESLGTKATLELPYCRQLPRVLSRMPGVLNLGCIGRDGRSEEVWAPLPRGAQRLLPEQLYLPSRCRADLEDGPRRF